MIPSATYRPEMDPEAEIAVCLAPGRFTAMPLADARELWRSLAVAIERATRKRRDTYQQAKQIACDNGLLFHLELDGTNVDPSRATVVMHTGCPLDTRVATDVEVALWNALVRRSREAKR